MTSGYWSIPGRAFTQNSKAPTEKFHCHFREPCESVTLNQHVVSADQTKSLGGYQLTELNSQETSLSDPQDRVVPDSQGRVHKEGSQVKALSRKETLVIHSTAVC